MSRRGAIADLNDGLLDQLFDMDLLRDGAFAALGGGVAGVAYRQAVKRIDFFAEIDPERLWLRPVKRGALAVATFVVGGMAADRTVGREAALGIAGAMGSEVLNEVADLFLDGIDEADLGDAEEDAAASAALQALPEETELAGVPRERNRRPVLSGTKIRDVGPGQSTISGARLSAIV